jgi:hypothetical protein
MPAIILAAIDAAFHEYFMQAVREDRSEFWHVPSARDLAPKLTPLESLLANLALGDRRESVRDAARAAYEDPAGDGLTRLTQAVGSSAIGVVLQDLVMRQYNGAR